MCHYEYLLVKEIKIWIHRYRTYHQYWPRVHSDADQPAMVCPAPDEGV
jgi:hypothetical protein